MAMEIVDLPIKHGDFPLWFQPPKEKRIWWYSQVGYVGIIPRRI